jgi:hypothetical protein
MDEGRCSLVQVEVRESIQIASRRVGLFVILYPHTDVASNIYYGKMYMHGLSTTLVIYPLPSLPISQPESWGSSAHVPGVQAALSYSEPSKHPR